MISQVGYKAIVHHRVAMGLGGLRLSGVVAVVFALANHLDLGHHARHTANAWNLAFMAAPLMAVVARAIKLDSRGPVLSMQTRRGDSAAWRDVADRAAPARFVARPAIRARDRVLSAPRQWCCPA